MEKEIFKKTFGTYFKTAGIAGISLAILSLFVIDGKYVELLAWSFIHIIWGLWKIVPFSYGYFPVIGMLFIGLIIILFVFSFRGAKGEVAKLKLSKEIDTAKESYIFIRKRIFSDFFRYFLYFMALPVTYLLYKNYYSIFYNLYSA